MKFRCKDKNNLNYGGRGIKYCDEWNKFENFYLWAMENGYMEGLDIDRIDVNGNYEPSNCRWISRKENNNNKRCTVIVNAFGKSLSVTQWAEYFRIHPSTIRSYVNEHNVSYGEYIRMRKEGKIGRKRKIASNQ